MAWPQDQLHDHNRRVCLSHAVGRQPLDGQAREREQQDGGNPLIRNSASFVCVCFCLIRLGRRNSQRRLARPGSSVCRARALDFGFVLVALLPLLLLLILAADSNPGVHPCWALLFQTQISQPLLSRPTRLSPSIFFFFWISRMSECVQAGRQAGCAAEHVEQLDRESCFERLRLAVGEIASLGAVPDAAAASPLRFACFRSPVAAPLACLVCFPLSSHRCLNACLPACLPASDHRIECTAVTLPLPSAASNSIPPGCTARPQPSAATETAAAAAAARPPAKQPIIGPAPEAHSLPTAARCVRGIVVPFPLAGYPCLHSVFVTIGLGISFLFT